MAGNPRVNALWLQGKLGPIERMSIASYLHHGHEIDLWSYDQISVPDGVTLHDAREVMPLPILLYKSPASHAGSPLLHVNLWRYKFMYGTGGYFTELDHVCLGRLPERHFISSEGDDHPNLAVMHIPGGSRLMQQCYRKATFELLRDAEKGKFGPKLISEFVNGEWVAPASWFCPVSWSDAVHILREPATVLPEDSIGCHLWGAVLRRNRIDVSTAQPGSLWHQWMERFKP